MPLGFGEGSTGCTKATWVRTQESVSAARVEVIVMVFLIHVRDPQFYADPAKIRARNGNSRVMGFPPIGIMSLSAVLKRAGHECVMFDQAHPDTPNDVIIAKVGEWKPDLVGRSFLSTT